MHVNPHDPLGVDVLLEARSRWDADLAETRRRWDALYPVTGEPAPAAPPQIPPPGDGGGRPRPGGPAPEEEELDLTRFDHLAQQTTKVHPYDDDLPQPPQSPTWIPPGSA